MNTDMPYSVFETGNQGQFLTLDWGDEKIALPYFSLAQVAFRKGDRITLSFANARVDLLGEGLEELFVLITQAKVRLVRGGQYAGCAVRKINVEYE